MVIKWKVPPERKSRKIPTHTVPALARQGIATRQLSAQSLLPLLKVYLSHSQRGKAPLDSEETQADIVLEWRWCGLNSGSLVNWLSVIPRLFTFGLALLLYLSP